MKSCSLGRTLAAALFLALTGGGVCLIVAGFAQARTPPPQLSGPAGELPSVTTSAPTVASPTAASQAGPPAPPATLDIPAIGIHAPVMALGLNQDGSLAVPPLNKANETGWYRNSAVPGQVGAAVILGHVDSDASGPAVFYNLAKMRPGQDIMITLKDDSKVTYRVDGLREFKKSELPLNEIYGPLTYPGLRLITCSGRFDWQHQTYPDNLVVFASMKVLLPDRPHSH